MDVDIDKLALGLTELVFTKFAEDEEDAVPVPESEAKPDNWSRWLKGLALGGGVALGAGAGLWAANRFAPQLSSAANWVGDKFNAATGAKPPASGPASVVTPGSVGLGTAAASLAMRNPITNRLITESKPIPKSPEHGLELSSMPTRTMEAIRRFGGGYIGPPTQVQGQQQAIGRNIEAKEPNHDLIAKLMAKLHKPTEQGMRDYDQARSDFAASLGGSPESPGKPGEGPSHDVMMSYQNELNKLQSGKPHALTASDAGLYFQDPSTGKMVRPENLTNVTGSQLASLPVATKTIDMSNPQAGKPQFKMSPVIQPGQEAPPSQLEKQVEIARNTDVAGPSTPEAKSTMAQAQIINIDKLFTLRDELAKANAAATPDQQPAIKSRIDMLDADIRRRVGMHDAMVGRPTDTSAIESPEALRARMRPAITGHIALRRAAADTHGGADITAPNVARSVRGAALRGVGATAGSWLASLAIPQSWKDWANNRNVQPEVVGQ